MFKDIKKKIIFLAFIFLCMVIVPILAVGNKKDGIVSVFSTSKIKASSQNFKNNSDNNSFCVLDEATNKILEIPDREFVYGVVASEMPALFEAEALKAQAVASYTYFSRARENYRKNKKNENPYEFTVNTDKGLSYITKEKLHERWGDKFETNYQKIKETVDNVFGEVLKEDGHLILAAYHAISSGKTEKSEDVFGGILKYLTNVESTGDKLVPGYETKVEIKSADFKSNLEKEWNDCNFEGDPSTWIGELIRTESGMVKEITICSHKTKGMDIRRIFALRSSTFDINYSGEEDKFTFTVRGYGHGVGLSQHGANYMAKQGSDYKQILQWYYPGTALSKL